MARSANQKLKLLYLAQYFHEMTDEEHPVSVAEIISYLGSLDIKAERKTIYDDIDIVQVRGKTSGYYVGAREFELPELKLLVDSVQSSKFITQKKTLSLIKKIEALANRFDAQLLQRQVYVRNRVKSMNESVYYNVDEISAAITRDREIRFRYFEYDLKKERRFRKNGEFYTVSPFALMWDDENYYMLAWDKDAEMLKHYRVDKKVFGMFTGAETRVKLRFANHLIGPVIDRFGKDLFISPDGEEHFTVHLDVAVSPQFYAWVFGFGAEAEILAPESVRSEMKTRLSESRVLYE